VCQAAGIIMNCHDDMHARELDTSTLLAPAGLTSAPPDDTAEHVATDRGHLSPGMVSMRSRATLCSAINSSMRSSSWPYAGLPAGGL